MRAIRPRRRRLPLAFDQGARVYDRLVGLNPGYHRQLRRSAAAFADLAGTAPRLLDAGCGTGASTAALLAAAPDARVTAVDASAGMLAAARAKPWPAEVEFVHSGIDEIDAAGVGGGFDGIFAAYLIRNVADPDATLALLRDRLRPGGLLVVHDYSIRPDGLARLVWHAVCWTVIIPAGSLASGDASLYRYLWRSALRFDDPAAFADRLRRAGFADVRVRSMTGWQRGVTHAFRGRRPVAPG